MDKKLKLEKMETCSTCKSGFPVIYFCSCSTHKDLQYYCIDCNIKARKDHDLKLVSNEINEWAYKWETLISKF